MTTLNKNTFGADLRTLQAVHSHRRSVPQPSLLSTRRRGELIPVCRSAIGARFAISYHFARVAERDDPRAIDAPDHHVPFRFAIIGRSSRDRVLFVVHAVVEDHGRVRIISARKASPAQRKAFVAK